MKTNLKIEINMVIEAELDANELELMDAEVMRDLVERNLTSEYDVESKSLRFSSDCYGELDILKVYPAEFMIGDIYHYDIHN